MLETEFLFSQGGYKKITSLTNPLIKDIRLLIAQGKHRKRRGLFVAEGLKHAKDAMEAGWRIQALLFAPSLLSQEEGQRLLPKVKAQGGTLIETPEALLAKITRRENAYSVLGVYHLKKESQATFQISPGQMCICLDRIRDAGNLGTILRTAAFAGAAGVVLIGACTDPFSFESVRASMGSVFHVPLLQMSQEEFLQWAAPWRAGSVGTHLKAILPHTQARRATKIPTLLLMGNEQTGLSPALEKWCSTLVCIPRKGPADSLNLAVATGILVYTLCSTEL